MSDVRDAFKKLEKTVEEERDELRNLDRKYRDLVEEKKRFERERQVELQREADEQKKAKERYDQKVHDLEKEEKSLEGQIRRAKSQSKLHEQDLEKLRAEIAEMGRS